MTRKDYEKFAQMFRDEMWIAPELKGEVVVAHLIKSSAEIFAQDNPRFDRDLFYEACGVKQDFGHIDEDQSPEEIAKQVEDAPLIFCPDSGERV